MFEILERFENANNYHKDDYHLHCNDDRFRIFLFLEKLKSKFSKEQRRRINISFSEHESFRIYSEFLVDVFCKACGINIIPSVTFVSNEDVEVISFFPKESSFKLLKSIQKEKLARLILLIERFYDLNLDITPDGLSEQIGRPGDLKSLHYVNDKHIINELSLKNELTERECISIYNRNVQDLIIEKKPIIDILNLLRSEDNIYLSSLNDDFFFNFDFDDFYIKGLILKELKQDMIDLIRSFNLDFKIGSGFNL